MREKKVRGTKRERRLQMETELMPMQAPVQEPAVHKELRALTEAQGHYILAMKSNQLTFGLGPAGTGKTFVCATYAAQLLEQGKIKKLIVTRPAIEAGRGMGFLPGTIEEKFAPYFAPFKQVLEAYFGRSHLEYLIRHGIVEIAPLEYIRGLTFDDAFVILDEAQNTTPAQMKLFLTRLGNYSTVVVNGDIDQKDIEGISGLEDAVSKLSGLDRVDCVEFTEDDVVRSGLVRDILKRYRRNM